MIKFVLWLICAAALAFSAWGLMENPGEVSITWLGYVVETSVAFCIALLFILALAIYLILFPCRLIRAIRVSIEKNRRAKGKLILIQILNNVLCDNLQENNKLIKQFQKMHPEDADIVLMLKALSKADADIYNEMVKKPETEQAGRQGTINELIKKGDVIKAGEEIDTLLKKNPKSIWALSQAFYLYIQNEEWQKATDCLEKLRKTKAVSDEQYRAQKAVLLVKQGKGNDAFKACPALPAAVILAAKQNPKKAQKIYAQAWKAAPSFEVYRAFVKLYAKENTLSQYQRVLKLCENNKNAKLNALVIADAAANAKLWSEAKKELNGYVAAYPLTINVAAKMAWIEMSAFHNMKEAQKWIDKMADANPCANYICSHCGHKINTWSAACPVCNAFAGLKVS